MIARGQTAGRARLVCPRAQSGRNEAMRTMAFGPAILVGALMGVGAASAMTVTSPDIKPGAKIADEQVFNGWDCTGKNVSPALSCRAPKDTKSFAVSMHDPDAPTGSGFWHWWVTKIPATVTSLPKGAGGGTGPPIGGPGTTTRLPDMAGHACPRASRIATRSPSLRSKPTTSTSTTKPRRRCSASPSNRTRWRRRRHRPLRAVGRRPDRNAAPLQKRRHFLR